MLIFLAWDGDHIGRQVGRASLADDAEGLRRISQAIDQGNLVWKSWIESKGGSLISMGGDEGRAEIPADALDELPAIREQYAGKVNAPVSVGVGMKLSEADKALVAAKLQGGDRIVFYTEEVGALVARAAEHGEKTEEAKITDEYLKQDDAYLGKAAPAMNPHAFSGAKRPSAPTVAAPTATQGDHEQGQVINDLLNGEGAPAPAEQTHAAKDFEQQLHDEAWKGEEDDMADGAQKHTAAEQVKAQVVEALQALKAQGPVLEQVKSVAPAAYKAMMLLAQSVIGLAKQLAPAQPMKKAEGEHDKTAQLAEAVRTAHKGDDRGKIDLEHCPKGDCYEQADALYHLLGGEQSGYTPHFLYHGEFGPHWFLKNGENRILDTMADAHHEPLPYDKGLPAKFLTDGPSQGAMELIHKVLGFEPPTKPLNGEPIEKGGLPMPKVPTRNNVVLPVGSEVDQKIKVQHQDGTSSWKQVGAGEIRSMDPAGHATSSRTPNSR